MIHLHSEQRVFLQIGEPRHSLRAISLTREGGGYITGTRSLLPNIIAVSDIWRKPGFGTVMVEDFQSEA